MPSLPFHMPTRHIELVLPCSGHVATGSSDGRHEHGQDAVVSGLGQIEWDHWEGAARPDKTQLCL